jgi:cysteine-rich repeat protein
MSKRTLIAVLVLSFICVVNVASEVSAQNCFWDSDCAEPTPRCSWDFVCAECYEDWHCGDGVACTDNFCSRTAPPPVGNCSDDSDCDEWEECVGTLCMLREEPEPEPEPSVCGDGTQQQDEQCDDANTLEGDGCNRCVREVCGDGILQPSLGEECDYAASGDGCTNECRLELRCGNGILELTEQCEVGLGGWTERTCNGPTCTRRLIVRADSPNVDWNECDLQIFNTCLPSCLPDNECENLPGGYEVCWGGSACTYDCSGSNNCPSDMHCILSAEQYVCVAN